MILDSIRLDFMVNVAEAGYPVHIKEKRGETMNLSIDVRHLSLNICHTFIMDLLAYVMRSYGLSFKQKSLQNRVTYESTASLENLKPIDLNTLVLRYSIQPNELQTILRQTLKPARYHHVLHNMHFYTNLNFIDTSHIHMYEISKTKKYHQSKSKPSRLSSILKPIKDLRGSG